MPQASRPDEAPDADADDIAAARRGDGDAYRRLIHRHQRAIAIQLGRFSRDPLVREELLHDVFVEAYLSLQSYRATAPWLHWLRRIAVRVGYRYWRGREPAPAAVNWRAARRASPADAVEAADLVQAMLARLGPAERLVLTLIYLDDCTMAEAAALAGWTVAGTKVRAHRARRKLARWMEDER